MIAALKAMNTSAKMDRFERTRRNQTLYITLLVGLGSAAIVAGMIYLYYKTCLRF